VRSERKKGEDGIISIGKVRDSITRASLLIARLVKRETRGNPWEGEERCKNVPCWGGKKMRLEKTPLMSLREVF